MNTCGTLNDLIHTWLKPGESQPKAKIRNRLNGFRILMLLTTRLKPGVNETRGSRLHADGRQRFFFQLLSLVMSGERFDNRVERSVHDLIQLMNSQTDAVVANAVLFVGISADF